MHIDPGDLTIAETEDGGARIDIETMILTSDINGYVHDSRHSKYTFNFEPEKKAENIARIQKHGLRLSLLLPVKKPGFYSVHIAVQDVESGMVGSAYQFVEIPDLNKNRLALSDIFIITRDEDLVWMRSDATEELAVLAFFPILQEDVRSPALRTFMPGDHLRTLAMLYNADARAIVRSEIEMQSILYRDGREFLSSESGPVVSGNVKISDGIPILQGLALGSDLPAGNYLLQLLVTDKKNSQIRDKEGVSPKEREGLFMRIVRAYLNEPRNYSNRHNTDKGVASQILSFTVTEEP